jgi:hypothetical protein
MLLSLGFVFSGAARGQSLDWAVRAGGDYFAYFNPTFSEHASNGIAVYGPGNSCVTGSFSGTETFGVGQIHETTLTSAGGADIFVAKYDGTGALQWVRRAGGADEDAGLSAAVDGAGNCYVTGIYRDIPMRLFIAKFTTTGEMAWSRLVDGAEGLGIAADSAGNSYVTGAFDGFETVFGVGEANQTTFRLVSYEDVFVAKYDRNGMLLWAKQALDPYDLDHSYDFGYGIGVDSVGNVYVVGSFEGASVFGPGEANETLLLSGFGAQFGMDSDIFIVKYSGAGALQWAKSVGGLTDEEGYDIAVDPAGNSYVTGSFGWFGAPATFGQDEANETILTTDAGAWGDDVFVAKYNSAGALLWAKRAGGVNADRGYGIAMDAAGYIAVAGSFGGMADGLNLTATFGPGEALETTLASSGTDDAFLAKYDGSGALVWAKQAGGPNYDRALDVAVDAAGKSYVTGVYDGPAVFGSGEANETTLQGLIDFFVARYDSNGWTPGTSVTRIHAGELKKSYTDVEGRVWQADRYYLLGGISGTDYVYNTPDVELYRKGRRGIYQDFGYAIPVTNGDYYVTLKFAEQQVLTKGQRVFNVTIEGVTQLVNFDITAEVPLKTALDKTFAVHVTDGVLNIAFEHVVNRGTISAIEVVPLN